MKKVIGLLMLVNGCVAITTPTAAVYPGQVVCSGSSQCCDDDSECSSNGDSCISVDPAYGEMIGQKSHPCQTMVEKSGTMVSYAEKLEPKIVVSSHNLK